MIPASFFVDPGQENRIRKAIKNKKGCRIRVTKHQHPGPHHLLVTTNALKRYAKAQQGESVPLSFKHEHLKENLKHLGGFLPLIAALLAPVIGGVAGGLIEKEIAGSGIKGKGLHLNPYQAGNGLYLNPYTKN